MIDISRAQAIDGWMSDKELTWLAQQAQKHKSIVEIGSWKGRSTRALIDHTEGNVWAIDHWRGQELTESPTSLDVEVAERGSDAIFNEFCSNTENISSTLWVIRRSSAEAAEVFKTFHTHVNVDMVFLDGEHAYAGVKADIELWTPFLISGGLLCGHDWWHGGIKRAVRELVPGFQVVPDTNIWWVIKR